MVTLITEKLRSQTLQDVPSSSNIQQQLDRYTSTSSHGESRSNNSWSRRQTLETTDEYPNSISVTSSNANNNNANTTVPLVSLRPCASCFSPTKSERFSSGRHPHKNSRLINSPRETSHRHQGGLSPEPWRPNNSSETTPPKKRHCRSFSNPSQNNVGGCDEARGGAFSPPSNILCPVPIRLSRVDSAISACRRSSISPIKSKSVSVVGFSFSNEMQSSVDSVSSEPWSSSTPPESPVPRPASVTCSQLDNHYSNAPWLRGGNDDSLTSKSEGFRSLSLSEEKFGSSTQTSQTPPASNRSGITRCRSQPCVSNRKRKKLKRTHDGYVNHRPSLDLTKMSQTSYDKYPRHVIYHGLESSQGVSSCLKNLSSMFSDDLSFTSMLNTISPSPRGTTPVPVTPPSSPIPHQHRANNPRNNNNNNNNNSANTGDITVNTVDITGACESDTDCMEAMNTLTPVNAFQFFNCPDLDLEKIEND